MRLVRPPPNKQTVGTAAGFNNRPDTFRLVKEKQLMQLCFIFIMIL